MDDGSPELESAFEVRVDIGPSEHVGHGEGVALEFAPGHALLALPVICPYHTS
jgi:hypothetical protein